MKVDFDFSHEPTTDGIGNAQGLFYVQEGRVYDIAELHPGAAFRLLMSLGRTLILRKDNPEMTWPKGSRFAMEAAVAPVYILANKDIEYGICLLTSTNGDAPSKTVKVN